MKDKFRNVTTDRLFKAILSLETIEDCYVFFSDLCTIPEVYEMARRLTAAKMLSEGIKYTEIAEATGLSTATISRVNRSLKYGDGGYQKALEALSDDE